MENMKALEICAGAGSRRRRPSGREHALVAALVLLAAASILSPARADTPAESAPLAPPAEAVLYLDLPDTVIAGKPFSLILRAFDREGLPLVRFAEPVSFECLYGVSPVMSRATWKYGYLVDTLVIERPGRNVNLRARAGDGMASRFLDVSSAPWDKARWLKLAEEHLAAGKTDAAIDALERAVALEPAGDAEIERRIANLYLAQNRWDDAERHFQRAVQAVIANLRRQP